MKRKRPGKLLGLPRKEQDPGVQAQAIGRGTAGILYAIFFVSGASALIFESVWFHACGLVFGNSVWASAIILASFMGGLALGNGLASRFGSRIGRPMALYALAELAIALAGMGLTLVLPRMSSLLAPVLRPFADSPWLVNPLRLAMSFGLMLVPTTAMGATLPVLVTALCRSQSSFGAVLGRLYGWNTLGAVTGLLAVETFAIECFGIRGASLFAACLNSGAGLTALRLSRHLGDRRWLAEANVVTGAPSRLTLGGARLLVAASLSGAALLALEVVGFRFLAMFVVTGTLAFSMMLAVVLVGIGSGGLVASWILERHPDASRFLPILAGASAIGCVATYAGFQVGSATFARAEDWHSMLALAIRLIVPMAFLSGVLFTFQGQALRREVPNETRGHSRPGASSRGR